MWKLKLKFLIKCSLFALLVWANLTRRGPGRERVGPFRDRRKHGALKGCAGFITTAKLDDHCEMGCGTLSVLAWIAYILLKIKFNQLPSPEETSFWKPNHTKYLQNREYVLKFTLGYHTICSSEGVWQNFMQTSCTVSSQLLMWF